MIPPKALTLGCLSCMLICAKLEKRLRRPRQRTRRRSTKLKRQRQNARKRSWKMMSWCSRSRHLKRTCWLLGRILFKILHKISYFKLSKKLRTRQLLSLSGWKELMHYFPPNNFLEMVQFLHSFLKVPLISILLILKKFFHNYSTNSRYSYVMKQLKSQKTKSSWKILWRS